MTVKILVCGGRNFNDRYFLYQCLDNFCLERGFITPKEKDGNYLPNVFIVAGGATGADSLAIDWAVINCQQFKEYPADWLKYGRRAGPIRNVQMLDEENPEFVLAFPGGAGTEHMKRVARQRNIEVIEFKKV